MHQHEVLDDVDKHLDRMRLFDVIARFLSLRCKHTLETKNPRKTKNLRVYGGFCFVPLISRYHRDEHTCHAVHGIKPRGISTFALWSKVVTGSKFRP